MRRRNGVEEVKKCSRGKGKPTTIDWQEVVAEEKSKPFRHSLNRKRVDNE